MKKLHVSSVSILFAALCLAFTACNQGVTAGNGTGTVRVVIGGETARAVDAAGMPVFDGTNTKITVTGEDGTKLAEGTTSVTVEVGIGTKITVKAVVTTAAGVWRGSTEHTVTEGDNPVSVKLSKAPNSVGNILIDVVEQNPKYGQVVKFKLAGGKELVSKALISNQEYLVTARDSIGRIYVLYKEGHGSNATLHFKRYDTEGNEDAGFEAAIMPKLPSDISINIMTVDAKTGTIFIVGMAPTDGSKHAYAVTEKGHNNFTLSNDFNLASFIESGNTIQTAAAYNGTLFFTVPPSAHGASGMENKLVAVKAELSGYALTLTKKDEKTLPKLRPHNARNNTECSGLFADESGVYCLLSDQNLYGGNLYALGQIVRYQYSGSAFTGETKIGLNPKAEGTDGIPFDAQYFSNPVGFIGYDEENIYIADDGYNIEYLNETWRTNGNKNRIAAFNRKTNEITFTDTAATWYEQKPEYKYPNTKILLWEKDSSSGKFHYWTSADGTEAFTAANKLFEYVAGPGHEPTDVFCYDQDGNLYILYKDGSHYKVRRFELKNGTSYATGVDSHALSTPSSPSYIAVDIFGGQNYLYCGYKDSTNDWKVERMSWIGNFATLTTPYPIWSITVGNDLSKKLTALAANKDGVFVATKETYQDGSIDKYRLKVQKYDKETGVDTGDVMVDNSVAVGSPPPSPSHNDYTTANTSITGLQVVEGQLYAITATEERLHKYKDSISHYVVDVFKHSSVLYKLPKTKDTFSGSIDAENSHKKNAGDEIGYGFYRFIAVKPKKLVIASDSGWGKDGLVGGHWDNDKNNTDTVLEFDLKNNVFGTDKKAGGTFSKKLVVSGFDWN